MGRKRSGTPARGVVGGRERVWLGGSREAGGRYYYLPGKPGSRENDSEYARLLTTAAASPGGVPMKKDGYLMLDLLADWQASDEGPSDRRDRSRVEGVAKLLSEHYLSFGVEEFTAASLAAWQRWLCDLRIGDRLRYNRSSVATFVGIVRKAYSWGVVQGIVAEDHAASLERVQPPKRGSVRSATKRPAVAMETVTATLPHLCRVTAGLVRAILYTAARPDEIYRLRPCDVRQSGTVVLPSGAEIDLGATGCWAYVPVSHKNSGVGQDRCILFFPEARAALQPFLDRDPQSYCFDPREAYSDAQKRQSAKRGKTGAKYVYGNRKPKSTRAVKRPGGRYTSHGLNQAIRRACAKAGVAKWTAYQLRKRALVDLRKRYGVEVAAAIAGHASSATTEASYAPPSVANAADVIAGKR